METMLFGEVADGDGKPYFCHVCSRRIIVSDESEPFCPICLQSFVEEYTNPNSDPDPIPNPNPSFSFGFSSDPSSDPHYPFHPLSFLPLLLSSASSTTIDLQNPQIFSGSSGSRTGPDFPESEMFDPFLFLQSHLQGLRADGTNVQFEINHPSEPGFRLPSNIGDYFLGPGLEQLIQQLAENDPNRYGTPPASKSAIQNLPTVTVDDKLLNSEHNQCAVCQDEFKKGSQVKQMPCKHVYHDECLLPWLQLHNSCPVCRYELPTDDPDYDNRMRGGNGGDGSRSGGGGSNGSSASRGGGGGGGGSGSGGGNTTPIQRTVRISLRYPSVGGGSAQEGSERGRGTRQEDLD